jgi:hypothetical protein
LAALQDRTRATHKSKPHEPTSLIVDGGDFTVEISFDVLSGSRCAAFKAVFSQHRK